MPGRLWTGTVAAGRARFLAWRAGVQPERLRAVSLDVGADEPIILFTTLRRADYSRARLMELYRMRWGEEEFFKSFKSDALGLGQFHSKSSHGVRQEIHAALLYSALSRDLLAAAAKTHGVPHGEPSPKAGATALADTLVPILLTADPEAVGRLLEIVLQRLARSWRRPRPGRRAPRRSFKPRPKWGAKGRRGREGR
jgi:hypothetical protein